MKFRIYGLGIRICLAVAACLLFGGCASMTPEVRAGARRAALGIGELAVRVALTQLMMPAPGGFAK